MTNGPVLVAAIGGVLGDSGRDAALFRWAATFDPAPILPAIQAPTLVLERAVAYHDLESRRLAAAQIPNARYVLLPGADALPYLGTPTRSSMRSRSSSPGRAAP
jgi:pimeloyl-ACP methyl ester carboxylesterase